MLDIKNAVYRCDFCNREINKIFKIYSSLIMNGNREYNECCCSCQQSRKYHGDIFKKNNKYYWR